MSDMIGNFEHGFIPHDVECLQMGNRIKELEAQLEQANKGYTWASVAFEKSQKKIEELEKQLERAKSEADFLRDKYKVDSYEATIKVLSSELDTEKEKYQEMVRTNEHHVNQLASMWKPVSLEEIRTIMALNCESYPNDEYKMASAIINRLEGMK